MRPGIEEVAARAGVSPTTVSRVLNNAAVQIAAGTRERVERAARELRYQPSAVARALVRRQTGALGVVLPPTSEPPLRNPFFSALLGGVLEAATLRHRNVMVFTSQTGEEAQRSRSLAHMRDGRCDGLIVFYQPSDNDILPTLLSSHVPCVLVSDWRDDPRLPCVDVQNEAATYGAADYLLELGHRRIAFLATEWHGLFSQQRVDGYHRALRERGLPGRAGLLVTGLRSWDVPTIFSRVEELMRLPDAQRPTALMCPSDDIAAACLAALARLGRRVPEDVSVTGFNDDDNARRQHPALTTVRQPYLQLGEAALDLLLERIAGGDEAPARKLRLPTELVVRGSTGPPPAEGTGMSPLEHEDSGS